MSTTMEAASAQIPDLWRSYTTICRLCLQKDGFMLGIFNHIQGRDKSIYKKIMDCTALQISYGDGLPNVICHRCLYKIEFCLEFRQLCFMSDVTLRQISGVSQTKETNGTKSRPPFPLYEQLNNGTDENVVMVVDPTAPDYESEYESETERRSDNETVENNEVFESRNVSMCRYCDQAFTDKNECLNHETTNHNSEDPFSCTDCSMHFADRLQYSTHLKSVHQIEKPYNCPLCDRTFARRSDLRKHTLVHTGIKPFTCTICFKSFSRNTNLSKHMRIHSGQRPFVCPKCPKNFTTKSELTLHAVVHTTQKPFPCNFCPMSFSRRDKLLRHEKRHFPVRGEQEEKQLPPQIEPVAEYGYPETQPEQEEKQDSGWASSENMVINLDPFNHNNFTGTERPAEEATPIHHQENGGSETDPNNDDLPRVPDHMQDEADLPLGPAHITGDSSSSERIPNDSPNSLKLTCNICLKQFSSPSNLKYHEGCHTGIRPYTCSICTKSFIRKRELDRHIQTHSGMKPFKCPTCEKSFGRKDKLVRHVRIHEIKKEHSCLECGATFNRRDSLTQHLKTHVKDEPDVVSQNE